MPPEAPPLPELDELLLDASVLGVGTPAAEAAPPALGTPSVGDELPPAPLDPPDEPELPPAFAPAWPPAPAAPPLSPPLLAEAPPATPPCDPELAPDWPPCDPLDGDAAPDEPLDPLWEPAAPPLLEDAPPDDEGIDAPPEEPEEPEEPELLPDEDEDEELDDEAPPLLEEDDDCWLAQPPIRNADTVPTKVPCAARSRMRRIAPCTVCCV